MNKFEISEVQIVPLRPQNGLVAFASCILSNQFFIGNIAVYSSPSTKSGFRLVFPTKKLTSGRMVDCFHPINKDAGELIALAVIKKYIELMDNFHHVEV